MKETRVERNGGEYRGLRLLNLGYSLGLMLMAVALCFSVWLQSIRISDNGMAPTLRQGDIVLFDRLAKYLRTPARGDAYAFTNAGGVSLGRVVGLPGEAVCMVEGELYINGMLLDERRYVTPSGLDMPALTLGQDEFFLLPDDRTMTVLDPDAMTVPFARLQSRAFVRVAPWGRVSVFTARTQ